MVITYSFPNGVPSFEQILNAIRSFTDVPYELTPHPREGKTIRSKGNLGVNLAAIPDGLAAHCGLGERDWGVVAKALEKLGGIHPLPVYGPQLRLRRSMAWNSRRKPRYGF